MLQMSLTLIPVCIKLKPPSPYQVFNVASLPISESSGMKSDESGFSESMHLSYTSAKTQSYSTASTQTPPELNPPEDDLQTGKT